MPEPDLESLCSQTPEVGAKCPNWDRSDLCGRYNHLFGWAFDVITDEADGDKLTGGQLRAALQGYLDSICDVELRLKCDWRPDKTIDS